MSLNIHKVFSFFIFLVILSCNTTKKAATTDTKTISDTPLSISTILSNFANNEIKAAWMSSDMDVDYAGKPMSISAAMSVRMKRDSIIWVNIKKLGFNIGRAKITPDSVFVINYLQNNYVAKDLKYVESKFNLPADFNMIQNILLGNPVFLTDKNKLSVERDATGDIILRGKDSQWQTTYKVDATGNVLKEMIFEQPIAARTLKIAYKNFDIMKGYAKSDVKFAYLRTFNVDSPQTGKAEITLEIESNSLEVDVPKNIRFDIPTHYTRVD